MNKLERKKYKLFIKKYRKIFISQAKEAQPYDWGFMYESIRTYITFMYEYFKTGINVWQVEESKQEILNSLEHCMNIYKELDSINDIRPELKMEIKNNIITFIETEDERKQNAKINQIIDKKEQQLFKDLFDTIRDNLKSWWD